MLNTTKDSYRERWSKVKKVLIILCIIFSISLVSTGVKALTSKPTTDVKWGIPYKYTPAEGSVEELYKNLKL